MTLVRFLCCIFLFPSSGTNQLSDHLKLLQCCWGQGFRPLSLSPPLYWQLKCPHPQEFAIQGRGAWDGHSWNCLLHKNQPNHGSQIQGADWEILVLWAGWVVAYKRWLLLNYRGNIHGSLPLIILMLVNSFIITIYYYI